MKKFLLFAACLVGFAASAAEVTDVLTPEVMKLDGKTNYAEYKDITAESSAVYYAQCANGNSAIQLRSNNNNSGIVSTVSGGMIKTVTIEWNSGTADARVISVYGSNEPFTDAKALYGSSVTLLGELAKAQDQTTLDVQGDYAYVGIRSKSSALYLNSVSFTWAVGEGGGDEPVATDYSVSLMNLANWEAPAAVVETAAGDAITGISAVAQGDLYTYTFSTTLKPAYVTFVNGNDSTEKFAFVNNKTYINVDTKEQTFNVNDATDFEGTFIEEEKKEDGTIQAAKRYLPLESLNLGGYTFATVIGTNEKNAPAYYYPTSTSTSTQNTIRLYTGNELTVTAPEGTMITKCSFTGQNGAVIYDGVPTASFKYVPASNVRFETVTFTYVGKGGDTPVVEPENPYAVTPGVENFINRTNKKGVITPFFLGDALKGMLTDAGFTVNEGCVINNSTINWYWWDGWSAGDTTYPDPDNTADSYVSQTVTGYAGWSGGGTNVTFNAGFVTDFTDESVLHITLRSTNLPTSIGVIFLDGSKMNSQPANISFGAEAFNDNGTVYPLVGSLGTDGEWVSYEITFAQIKALWSQFDCVNSDNWYGNAFCVLSGNEAGTNFSICETFVYTPVEDQPVDPEPEDQWTDILTAAKINIAGNSYTDYTYKGNTDAVYALNCMKNKDEAIQIRTKNNNSGIVSTVSGGYIKRVAVQWGEATAVGAVLNVYVSNDAYTAPTDLYAEDATPVATIVKGESTEVKIEGAYKYVGVRSANNAMYLDKVEFNWSNTNAIEAVETSAVAPVVYYNLQGVRVANPQNGLYIRVQGTEVSKVIIR